MSGPLAILQNLPDDALVMLAEEAIRLLDARLGDVEAEAEDEGCCEAYDDFGTGQRPPGMGGIGDADDAEDDDPAEHDDDDTDNAYEDVPTTMWFATPSGTASVADFQRAISDGKPGNPEDAEEDDAPEEDDTGRCGACDPLEELDPHH